MIRNSVEITTEKMRFDGRNIEEGFNVSSSCAYWVVAIPNINTRNAIGGKTVLDVGIKAVFRGKEDGNVMTLAFPRGVKWGGLIEVQDSLACEDCNPS